jgi:hypothetical protein
MMDRLSMKFHCRPARFDGEIGPATGAAMDAPRCGMPDFCPTVQAAIGTGSFAGCHGIGNFHAAKIYVDMTNLPSFLAPYFEQAFSAAVASFVDIGHKWIRVDRPDEANTHMSFVRSSNGWIGLATVGQGESCSSTQTWCRFLATYKPQNILNEWTTLLRHEWAHILGLMHTRDGCMSPTLQEGLAPTWRGDSSEPVLVQGYGGVPVDGGPVPGAEYWTHQGLKSNKGRTLWIPIEVPYLIEG